MTDLLTKLLEWGLGLVILGVIVGIGIAWFFKIKNQMQKKTKQQDTIKELRKLGEK